jgi:hypothetical protein
VFRELLDNPSARHPRELQADSATKFPEMVASSKLKLLKPLSPITEDAVLLIGVASYSVLDLELLDRLAQNAHQWSDQFSIYVTDLATVHSIEDLQLYFFTPPFWFSRPECSEWPPVKQTPIVVVLKADAVVEFRQGVGPCQRLLEDLNVL